MSLNHPRPARSAALAGSIAIAVGLPAYGRQQPAVADAYALPPSGGTLVVTNCDDAGPGSLRATVYSAFSGDTVDLSQLPCSVISLTTGPIVVSQDYLSLVGPGSANLTIEGSYSNSDGVIAHVPLTDHNQLALSHLTVANGINAGSMYLSGGCVSSLGNIVLSDVVISSCVLAIDNSTAFASGGGISAGGNLSLVASKITGNVAYNAGGFAAQGGGLYAGRTLTILYSEVTFNSAQGSGGYGSQGGGFATKGRGDTYIGNSLLAGNYAGFGGAVACDVVTDYPSTTLVVDSTISGNSALEAGGVACYQALSIWNSTIVFNTSNVQFAGGVYAPYVELHSSMLADNILRNSSPNLYDIGAWSITGDTNLITAAVAPTLPADTLTSCPRLGPLANNGGSTRTHALAHDSPGLNTGSNHFPPGALQFDQRGADFVRTFASAPDIGAFEWQGERDDRLFFGQFENRCQ